MKTITDILGLIAGVAGGGWGALAAIVALAVVVFFVWRAIQSYLEKKAHEDTLKQNAKDQAEIIAGNQAAEAQAKKDEQAAADALKKLGGADARRSDDEPRP